RGRLKSISPHKKELPDLRPTLPKDVLVSTAGNPESQRLGICAYGGGENAASLLLINSRNMSGAPGGAGDVTPAEPGRNVASDTCAARIPPPGSPRLRSHWASSG